MATPFVGNSIVDYLKSVGQASDFASRAKLAASKGIQGYVGSAEQNTQLLNMLRTTTPPIVAPTAPPAPPTQSFSAGQPAPAPVAPPASISAGVPKAPITSQRTPDGRFLWIDTVTGQEKGIFNTKAELLAARDRELAAQQPQTPPAAPQAQPVPVPGASTTPSPAPTTPPASTTVNPISQNEFQLRSNETIEQYKERIAARFAEGATAAPYTDVNTGLTVNPAATPGPTSPGLPPENDFGGIFDEAGVGGLSTSTPIQDVIKTVSSAFGLDNITKEMTSLDDDFADEVSSINSNPWISEGLRSKEVVRAQEKYERKREGLVNRLRLQSDVAGKAIDVYFKQKDYEKDIVLKKLELAGKQTDDLREYAFSKDQGYTGTFIEWQREQANLKAKAIGDSGLTPQQTQNFLRISDSYQKDEVIKLGRKGQFSIDIADQVIANPNNATNQLKALYTLIKTLDQYDSTVREGELALANQTQSYFQVWGNAIQRVASGRVISPSTALEFAKATKDMANLWVDAVQRRENQYSSQANVAGVGNAFQSYLSGFQSNSVKVESPSSVPSVSEQPEGFFDSFISSFGVGAGFPTSPR